MDSMVGDINSDFSELICALSLICSGLNRAMQSQLSFPDFNYFVNVLTGGIWPPLPESEFEDLDKTKDIRCPAEMEQIMQIFNSLASHVERNYKWSFVRGYVNITVMAGGREVLMQMLPIQGIVLMQFQKDEVWTVKELSNRINVSIKLIKSVVASLVFSKFQVFFLPIHHV